MRYCIFDPSGNITALVESHVPAEERKIAADEIMAAHPEVEQVGFVRFPEDGLIDAELQMAGGEFCGNASLCTAALFDLRNTRKSTDDFRHLRLKVSGADQPVDGWIKKVDRERYTGTIQMPPSLGITEIEFLFDNAAGILPVVRMQGISHIIIQPDSPFWHLCEDRKAAEKAVAEWCGVLRTDGLGLMFLKGSGPDYDLIPLVYIPGSGTIFWENSCGSGSSAVGIYLSAIYNRELSAALHQPGGILAVKSDPETGTTALTGNVVLISNMEM